MREKTLELLDEIQRYALQGYCRADIARLVGKDATYIGRLVKQNGLSLDTKYKRNDKPISEGLLQVGKALCEQRTYQLRISLNEMSKLSGFSVTRLMGMEMGTHNFTMLEFKKICEAYKLNPAVLLALI